MQQQTATENYINYKFTYINCEFISKMKDITTNEMNFVLKILKSPEVEYNATSIAKVLKISSMGALKIAKKLEKEGIIKGVKKGKATFYSLNLDEDYVQQYVKFLLQREAAQAPVYIRVWVRELRKLTNAYSVILFGSVLYKEKEARDIDAVVITDQAHLEKVKKEIQDINIVNIKKVHPIYQTKEDLKKNIGKPDQVVLNALKGIIVKGEDILLEALQK